MRRFVFMYHTVQPFAAFTKMIQHFALHSREKQLLETAKRAVGLAIVEISERGKFGHRAAQAHFTSLDNTAPERALAMQQGYDANHQYERTLKAHRPHTRLVPTLQYTNLCNSISGFEAILS